MPPKKAFAASKPAAKQTGGQSKSTVAKKPVVSKAKGVSATKSTTIASKKKVSSPVKKSGNKDKIEAGGKGEVEVVKLSKQDAAAIKLQSHFRVLLATKEIERRKLEKARYEEEMERLEREVCEGIKRNKRQMSRRGSAVVLKSSSILDNGSDFG